MDRVLRMLVRCLGIIVFSLLAGCGTIRNSLPSLGEEEKAPGSWEEYEKNLPAVPSDLSGSGRVNTRVEPAESQVVDAGTDPASLEGVSGLPSEDQLVFTDPDDPYASEELLASIGKTSVDTWLVSHSQARRTAMSQGKPLLVWFADTPRGDSGGSATSAALEQELLSKKKFSEWSHENFVRLKLEFNLKELNAVDPKKKALARKKKKYLESLKERYGVRGFPVLLVIAGDGSVVQRVRGYKAGTAEYTWGLLRTGLRLAEERQEAFEADMVQKGYRRWEGKNGLKTFAKLVRYREGQLLLVTPDGTRFKTHEKNLSQDDRDWIAEEKAKRER